jgi:hypothetical protein
MAASPIAKAIHGAATIRSVPVIRATPNCRCFHDQCTRWSCGPGEADMVTVWRRAARRVRAVACRVGIPIMGTFRYAGLYGTVRRAERRGERRWRRRC